MAKRKGIKRPTQHFTKNWATQTSLKTGRVNPEGLAVPVPTVVLLRCLHTILILPNVYIDPTLLYHTASLYLCSTSQENILHCITPSHTYVVV